MKIGYCKIGRLEDGNGNYSPPSSPVILDYCWRAGLLSSCMAFYISLSSCGTSPFPGYAESPNGLFYKLQSIGEGEVKAKPGDYVTAQITIRTETDSVLFDTRKIGLDGSVTFVLEEPQFEKDYREGFQYLSEGDSATFITDAHALYNKKNKTAIPAGLNVESIIKVEVHLLKVNTPEQHAMERAEEKRKLEQGEFEEKKILDRYLADSSIAATPFYNGMYRILLRKGNAITTDSARVLLINYRGCFLNGRYFDSSYESQPFEYIVGAEEQLIKGLEIGIRRMHEGEKTKFIIPSHLAFGSSGSSTGIVPPFTTVVYEVELLKVQ